MLDNPSWKKASTQVIQDTEVQHALSVYLVNQVYDNVDVSGSIAQELPPNLQGLAGPIAGALQEPASQAVDVHARPSAHPAALRERERVAHEKLVNVLENKTGNGISTGNGDVTLDLSQLVTELGTQLGLPQSALAKIPPNAGMITVMKSDQLSAAQNAVQALKALSAWLLVLVLFLFGAGALSGPRHPPRDAPQHRLGIRHRRPGHWSRSVRSRATTRSARSR